MLTLAVPVYNMEAYLPRCMDTLFAQTCRDFEILLIDDGSTDGSGAMCDAYAAGHPELVRVIHKKNGGLSSARNAGIDAAKGESIIFPDPDDWVEPDYVEKLLTLQTRYQADLVCTGYYIDAEDSIPGSQADPPVIMTGREAQNALILPPKMNGFAWNKLYRMDFIRARKLRFLDDVGTTEDMDFAYRYLAYCQTVCYAPSERTYHYYQRPGAATHSGFSSRQVASIHTYEKIIADCQSDRPELAVAAGEEICVTAVNLLWGYQNTESRDAAVRKQLLTYIRTYLRIHLTSHRYGMGRKLQAATAAVSPRLFALLKSVARRS